MAPEKENLRVAAATANRTVIPPRGFVDRPARSARGTARAPSRRLRHGPARHPPSVAATGRHVATGRRSRRPPAATASVAHAARVRRRQAAAKAPPAAARHRAWIGEVRNDVERPPGSGATSGRGPRPPQGGGACTAGEGNGARAPGTDRPGAARASPLSAERAAGRPLAVRGRRSAQSDRAPRGS